MRNGEVIILVREHIEFEHWSYAEYKHGVLVNRYSVEDTKKLMKNNNVIIL